MIALGISCSVIVIVLGIIFSIWMFCNRGLNAGKIILFVIANLLVVVACIGYCMSSVGGSIAGGGVFCAFTILIVAELIFVVSNKWWSEHIPECITFLIFGLMTFSSSVACFANYSYALGLGISCIFVMIACAIAMIVEITHFYSWSSRVKVGPIFVIILSIILTVGSVLGFISGFTLYDLRKEGLKVTVNLTTYDYDLTTQSVGKRVDGETLTVENYYAVKADVTLGNLQGLGDDELAVNIRITLPAASVVYVADGGIVYNETSSFWSYTSYDVNAKSKKNINSGYFIISYDPSQLENIGNTVKVDVYTSVKDKSGRYDYQLFKTAKYEHKLTKSPYDFTSDNFIKDLSTGGQGRYRIEIPEYCEKLFISIYDGTKSGLYCSTVEAVTDKYYYLSLYEYLQSNMSTEGFEDFMSNADKIIITVVAEESDYHTEKWVDIAVTLKSKI